MESLTEGDRVRATNVRKNHRHLKNQIGTVTAINEPGYAHDDVMVNLDSGGPVPFKVKELTKIN